MRSWGSTDTASKYTQKDHITWRRQQQRGAGSELAHEEGGGVRQGKGVGYRAERALCASH